MGIQPSMSVGDFLGSLPRIRVRKRRIWNVVDGNGNIIQGVSAGDNRRETAEAYIAGKYPGMKFNLVFARWKY